MDAGCFIVTPGGMPRDSVLGAVVWRGGWGWFVGDGGRSGLQA